ncbi:TAXI family TRAP transporter solute-binding subunit [Tritonibacter horizontis]|uniref:Putative aliphatic sulfonates-binding protein n=1 Tax=Tritonibacter horizontis TaxID=1768241 RepID=A0A132C241_9RHOB|nr:TAXI family TRAP transporter solute-binding subunit [Tritonibacter horizontis]KUP94576.1 putative aliphatic sulfonates-binding protein precursor [Tritonibacter horizontis]
MKHIVCVALLAASFSAFAPSVRAEEYRIGTASLGGAFFPMGQGISNLVNTYAGDGIDMVPIVTQGSVQNPRLVAQGEVELGITSANLAADAVAGNGAYDGTPMALSALGPLHPSVLHMVVPDGSDIRTFADLKGKRVAVGPAGGGTMGFLNNMLPIYGLNLDDITPSFLSYGDGFSQLSDGNVDAALALSGYPAAAVMQAAASGKLRMIGMEADKKDAILSGNPAYSIFNIPADVYGMDEDAQVLGVTNMLIVPTEMDAGIVERIAGAIYDHLDEFAAENANARQIDKARASALAIDLHPGAAAYFAR